MSFPIVAKYVSWIGLVLVIAPSLLALAGAITADAVKWPALAGTLVWFVSAALWMGRTTE